MTPQEQEQEAQVRLAQLRKEIARFNKARLRTEEYVRGVRKCRVPQEQVAALVQSLRDARAEEEAARQLLDLQRILLGREPTPGEAAVGVPAPAPGLGNPYIWLGVIAGTFGLVALFGYLTAREGRIQQELNPGSFTLVDVAGSTAQWLLPMAVVGGLIVGGYYLFSGSALSSLFGGRPKARPLPRTRLGAFRPSPLSERQTTKRPLPWEANAEPDEDEDEEPDDPEELDEDEGLDDEEGEE